MKFASTIVTFALALCVTASPTPEKRDFASISAAFTSVSNAVVALDTTILAYTGGATTAIENGSDAVVAATNAGTVVANASGALSELDALNLIAPIQALTTKVNATIDHLIAAKVPITAAGSAAATLADLVAQKSSATALANAVTAKVPANLQAIAASLSAGITDAIQRGIVAYT